MNLSRLACDESESEEGLQEREHGGRVVGELPGDDGEGGRQEARVAQGLDHADQETQAHEPAGALKRGEMGGESQSRATITKKP